MGIDFDLATIATPENLAALERGFQITLTVSAISWFGGMALAVLLLLVRLGERRLPAAAVGAFISYHRNVPVLVQVMLWYFGISTLLPDGVRQDLHALGAEFIFTAIALALYISAYFCEDLRSGLRAIPPGQHEAAHAVGLGFMGSMRHVILPQCVRNALPALINNTVVLFKASSLGMTVGLAELTYVTREIENYSFRTFEAYAVATAIYIVCSMLLMLAGAGLAHHYRKQTAR